MTAKHVGALAVIADQPALSTIRTPTGKTIYFQQIRELLLEDESTVYGCLHCDFTGSSPNTIRPHLRQHNGAPPKPKVTRPKLHELTLGELIKRLDELERVIADRDSWRTRALKAEGQLRGLRKTLRGDG